MRQLTHSVIDASDLMSRPAESGKIPRARLWPESARWLTAILVELSTGKLAGLIDGISHLASVPPGRSWIQLPCTTRRS
jgi:hypothetical protein